MEGDLRIEYVSLAEISGWPGNPKRHDLAGIGGSIDRWGFNDPLVRDERTGQLVEGHGRLAALEQRQRTGGPPPGHVRVDGGTWLVPVVRGVSFETEAEAEGYLLAHNQLPASGGWDGHARARMARTVVAAGVPAGALGFGAKLDKMIARAAGASEVREIQTGEVADEFWITVRGPLRSQREALDELRRTLGACAGVRVEIGVVERGG
jgi:hypothetical protein